MSLNWFLLQYQQRKKSPLQVLFENIDISLRKIPRISSQNSIKKAFVSVDTIYSKLYRVRCKSYTADGLKMQNRKIKTNSSPLKGEDRGVLLRKSYGRTPSEALAKEGGGDLELFESPSPSPSHRGRGMPSLFLNFG